MIGKYNSLFLEDPNTLGVRFPFNGGLSLGNKPLTDLLVNGFTFFFDFSYKEPLPDLFYLFQKGNIINQVMNRNLSIYLEKQEDGTRRLIIEAKRNG